MYLRYRKITTPIALLVTLALVQLCVGTSFAESNLSPGVAAQTNGPIMGILSTSDNKPITVNGAPTVSGASIPTGAIIETPDNVSATVKLGALGNVCIAPNTKLVLVFDRQGKAGNVNVNLTAGCAILRTLKDTAGSIVSPQGSIGQIESRTGGSIDVCLRTDLSPVINQGAASDAGAGASALDCGGAGAAAIPDGIPLSEALAMVAFITTIVVILIPRGGNPSPSGP